MFKNKIRLCAIAAMAGLLGFNSCKNDAELALTNQSGMQRELSATLSFETPVPLKEDWLNFPDIRVFERTISELEKLGSEDALDRWELAHQGFGSWRTNAAKEIFDKPDGDPVIDIPDPLLTTVLSKEGRIQIADTIYQVLRQRNKPMLYAIPEEYAEKIVAGIDPATITAAKAHTLGLLLLPFPRWEDWDEIIIPHPVSDICDFPASPLIPWWGQKGGSIYNADNGAELIKDNDRQVRIDYHRWRVGFIFYSSAGVRVKLWKHTRLGGWMSNIKMNSALLQSCSEGMVVIPGFLPVHYNAQVSASASNTNSLERTVKWAAAPLHVEVLPHHFSLDFTVNYKGQQIGRSIRE